MNKKWILAVMMLPMMALLTGCNKDKTTEEIAQESDELIVLANQIAGKPYSVARQAILEKEFTALSADTFKLEQDMMEYVVLTIENDTVRAVEAGKDHATQSDAKVALNRWSTYCFTNGNSLPNVSLWIGGIDTVYYTDGSDKEKIKTIVAVLDTAAAHGLLPFEIPAEFNAALHDALKRTRGNYQLDLQNSESEDIQEAGVYCPELDDLNMLSLAASIVAGGTDPSQMTGVFQNLMQQTYHVQTYRMQLRRQNISSKEERVRVIYTRSAERTITLEDLQEMM